MNQHGPGWDILAALDERTARIIRFSLELDKLKQVARRTPLLDGSRTETVAEHSWQVALMAVLLGQHAGPEVRVDRVVRMLLIHDLVEIDAGDTFLYDDAAEGSKEDREQRAAARIFGMLPDDLRQELRALWEEFEQRQTPDALFAAGLDRLQPLLHNYFTGGGTWKSPEVTRDKVEARKRVIGDASPALWTFGQALIADGVRRGYLRTGAGEPGQPALAAAGAGVTADATGAPLEPVALVAMADAPPAMRAVAEQYQRRFGTEFRTLTHVPAATLQQLHADTGAEPQTRVLVASTTDSAVRNAMGMLGYIANQAEPSLEERQTYFAMLQMIYRRLPRLPQELASRDDTLCLGPQREGRILASVLDCLPAGRHLTPSAKRMAHEGGLLVGLSFDDVAPAIYRRCVIVDGAIASGVTLMAIMHRLRPLIREFHVFSAHATRSSLRALARFGAWIDAEVNVTVGHVSGQLNEKYYAVEEDGRLVVGDLGDMISPVAP
jgi:putative hydrolase of HD superfamily